ncbi:MAG: class I SAM-dependent methyltransferase [Halochromatium sp.]
MTPPSGARPTRRAFVIGLLRRLPGFSTLGAWLRLPIRLRNRLRRMQSELDQLRVEHDQLSAKYEQLCGRRDSDLGQQGRWGTSLTDQEQIDLEGWYQGFQTSERGTFEAIQQRLADYLPLLREVLGPRGEGRVLDLGCGRGEWLDLLRRKGIEGFGVDDSAIAVAGARQRGLAVEHGDLFEILLAQPASSLDAVTAFQVVEHLPFAALYQLITQARRVLRPRGLLLLETPNPESLPVSSYSFWLDPTHRHPLPPPLLYDLVAFLGFSDLHVERSNPWPAPQLGTLDDMQTLLYQRLYCGQDYALSARAPSADAGGDDEQG